MGRACLPAALAALGAGLVCCESPPPSSRAPTAQEMAAESVVVNYAPTRLRVFPDRSVEGKTRYVILASERPQLPATWRPLGVSDKMPPPDYLPRAGTFVWLDDHVLSSALEMGDRSPGPPLLLFNKDGKPEGRPELALPAPCTVSEPALLQLGPIGLPVTTATASGPGATQAPTAATAPRPGATQPAAMGNGVAPQAGAGNAALQQAQASQEAAAATGTDKIYGLLRCGPEDRAVLLTLDGAGRPRRVWEVAGAGETDVYLHADADYLLAGRRVVRVDDAGRQTIGTVPPPGGGAETRALLRYQDELLIVDGAAGRVLRMDKKVMNWRGELRFPVGKDVQRLRAVISGDHLMLVVAERASGGVETRLYGIAVPLAESAAPPGERILLGAGPQHSDHELVPVDASSGGGALLVRTHAGNTGPLVALARLHF